MLKGFLCKLSLPLQHSPTQPHFPAVERCTFWGRQYSSASHDAWCPAEVEITVVLTRIIATAWTLESSHSRWMSKGLPGLSPPQSLFARGRSCLPHRAVVMGEYIHGTKQKILATVIVLFSWSLHFCAPKPEGSFLHTHWPRDSSMF